MFLRRLSALSLLLATQAHASVFTVGGDGACQFADLQTALDAAAANGPGEDEIRVMQGTRTQVHLSAMRQSFVLSGGWSSCAADASQSGSTVLSAGNAVGTPGAGPVLNLQTDESNYQTVTLQRLELRDGDNQDLGDGGGLLARGPLRVVLQEVRVVANRARVDGGGIAVQGPINGFGGILELQAGSEVSGNSAGGDGGGIALDFATLRMRADRTAIDANSAARGGGIAGFHASASVGNVGEPERQTDASGARIAHNSAQTGGGVYLGGSSLFDGTELALSYNTAYGNGGGFYAEGNSQFQMGRDYPNAFAVQCAPGAACGRIEGNRAGNGCPGTAGFGGGGYADGASVYLHQVEIVNNCAYGSPGLQSWGPRLDLEGVLFAGNRLRGRSIISYDGLQTLTYATRVGAPTGISHLSYVTFAQNLLLKDDGTTQAANAASLVSSGWNYTINAVASADPVPGFLNNYGVCNRSGVSLADFVDAAGGDYRPSPSGALVDACSTEQAPHEYRDPHLLARCQDDPNRNQGGTCDVGAYEVVPSAPADRLFADDFE